jgi:hypothetical protein
MNNWPTLVVAACLTGWYGTTVANPPDAGQVSVRLAASPQNAGRIAQVTLVPQGTSSTELVFFISGVPSAVTQPAHLYTYIYPGSCGNLGAKPAYAMNQQIVLGDHLPQRTWQMSKLVPVTLNELRSGDYAAVVRTSPADGYADIFCGNIGHAPPLPS